MAKVMGLGGVFVRSADPDALRAWYARVLGFEISRWGGVKFKPHPTAASNWTPFKADTDYFAPSTRETMINFIVDDLDGVLAAAAAEGVEPLGREAMEGMGRFAWLLDPDGAKVELWEPAAPTDVS